MSAAEGTCLHLRRCGRQYVGGLFLHTASEAALTALVPVAEDRVVVAGGGEDGLGEVVGKALTSGGVF